ncbi:MAG: MarR family winged helix-turn-helix transcriptional regulator [Deferribacterales bacterium]
MKKDYNDNEMLNMRLVHAIYNGMKNMRRKEYEKIKETGVTFAQFEVLVVVYHFQPMTVNAIIDKTLSTIGNISLVIANLVKEGYLDSVPDPKDKRSKLISLTKKGEKFMDDFFPEHLENLDNIFGIFSKEEKEVLLSLMRRLRIS